MLILPRAASPVGAGGRGVPRGRLGNGLRPPWDFFAFLPAVRERFPPGSRATAVSHGQRPGAHCVLSRSGVRPPLRPFSGFWPAGCSVRAPVVRNAGKKETTPKPDYWVQRSQFPLLSTPHWLPSSPPLETSRSRSRVPHAPPPHQSPQAPPRSRGRAGLGGVSSAPPSGLPFEPTLGLTNLNLALPQGSAHPAPRDVRGPPLRVACKREEICLAPNLLSRRCARF